MSEELFRGSDSETVFGLIAGAATEVADDWQLRADIIFHPDVFNDEDVMMCFLNVVRWF